MNFFSVMVISVVTNFGLAMIKVIGGIFGSSSALIADGVHSFSDLFTDFVAIIGNFLSKKPPDREHPFGHQNIEYITSFLISFVIFGVGFSIIRRTFLEPIFIPKDFVLVISAITIFVKFFLSHFILCWGKKTNNQILLASGNESYSDVFSSLVVLVCSFLMKFSGPVSFFRYCDKIGSFIVGCLILKIGLNIFFENLSYIIGKSEPDPYYLEQIQQILFSNDSVIQLRDFVLLKYGDSYKLTGSILMDENLTLLEAHQIVDELEYKIRHFNQKICYITLHMEPISTS